MEAVAGNFRVRPNEEVGAVMRRLEQAEDENVKPKAKAHRLDSEACERLLRRLRGWLQEEKDLQSDARLQMAIDDDFYDGIQWRAEDLEVMRDRMQPPLVFNRCALAVNWLFGTAMRMRQDWKVMPREKDDEPLAPVKTKLLKYVSDVNHASYERLAALKEALRAGISWVDHGIEGDETRELIAIQHESWRNVWHDSRNKRLLLQRGRYVFREKTVDDDIAAASWPDRVDVVNRAVTASEYSDRFVDPQDPEAWADGELQTGLGGTQDEFTAGSRAGLGNGLTAVEQRRRRIRVTECWYRVPVSKTRLTGGVFNGQDFDPNNPLMVQALREEACTARTSVRMEVRYAIWCGAGLLAEGRSPYKHNEFPLVPVVCYRRASDGTFYGVVRGMRDAQEDYNKRASKALHMLSTRGVLYEVGAFDDNVDDEEAVREEAARPDFFIGYKKGYKVEFIHQEQLAQGHLDLMERDGAHMEAASGVTNELMAIQTQAVSGKAIQARQQQGQLTTTEPFENFRLAQQLSGEITLSLCEQFHSAEFTFRITGDRGTTEFVDINKPVYNDEKGEWEWKDDITKRAADFVISEQDFRETVRQAQFEVMMEAMSRLQPEISIKLLDLAVELGDFENKKEWLRRIRMVNGMPDPEEDKTPEGQQAKAEREQRAAEAEEQQKRAIEAQIAKTEGEAAKAHGAAKLTEAQLADIVTRAVKQAMEAAQMIVTTPGVTPAADVILDVAGVSQFPASIPTGGAAQPAQLPNTGPVPPAPPAQPEPAAPPMQPPA